ncbi:DNA resolvase [Dyadobacter flavalbus]|uniref:DNA resolvase n=1 Tax=Dyadobacter flavalbus TaxID=2579942 RepID=A0A5M8QT54_9BACT|nr:recombinase family protein [Dyadobacter flavalbus]KAA6438044.1 DNA resolvase [Dyadobacter flavalbus]
MEIPETQIQKDKSTSPQAVIFTRVSKNVQNYQRQIDDLTTYATKQGWTVIGVIAEKISGSKSNEDRDGIAQLLESARLGKFKKVLVSEVSRLGRRPSQTHQVLEQLTSLKISLYIHQFNIETLLPNGKLNPAASMIFSITADMARQEKETHVERVISGMQLAKRNGQMFGRKSGPLYTEAQLLRKYAKAVKDLQLGVSIRKVAKIYGISADTVQRIKKLTKTPIPELPE